MQTIEKIAIGALARQALAGGALGAVGGGAIGAFSKKKKGEGRLHRIARGALTGAATLGGGAAAGNVAARGIARAAGKKGIPWRQVLRGKESNVGGMIRRTRRIRDDLSKPGGWKTPAAIAGGGTAAQVAGAVGAYKATRRKDDKK
jgi:hypothetical protein